LIVKRVGHFSLSGIPSVVEGPLISARPLAEKWEPAAIFSRRRFKGVADFADEEEPTFYRI
jgi:hypothetical protein